MQTGIYVFRFIQRDFTVIPGDANRFQSSDAQFILLQSFVVARTLEGNRRSANENVFSIWENRRPLECSKSTYVKRSVFFYYIKCPENKVSTFFKIKLCFIFQTKIIGYFTYIYLTIFRCSRRFVQYTFRTVLPASVFQKAIFQSGTPMDRFVNVPKPGFHADSSAEIFNCLRETP